MRFSLKTGYQSLLCDTCVDESCKAEESACVFYHGEALWQIFLPFFVLLSREMLGVKDLFCWYLEFSMHLGTSAFF